MVQSDGGSAFLQAFQAAAEALHLVHYFNRPNYPQGNGRVERSFRTDAAARAHGEEEFYQVEEMPTNLGGQEAALLHWTVSTRLCGRTKPRATKTPRRSIMNGCNLIPPEGRLRI